MIQVLIWVIRVNLRLGFLNAECIVPADLLFSMRAVVQRVTHASVTVEGEVVGEIGNGLVVLLGVSRADKQADADYLAEKIVALRIFEDREGRMNLSVRDIGGAILAVSQFTLYGDVRRGLRPSWSEAAAPEVAEPLYEYFVAKTKEFVSDVATGSFRRMMRVELVNDGPVTILLDSQKQF
jgi:D-tyrosyl-tRNA(Tyr) deacylase